MPLSGEYFAHFQRPLNPGLLRHQLTYQRKVVTAQNGFGEDQYAWTPVLSTKGQVKPLQGRELERAMQRWPEARYQILQHYSKGLERKDRIEWIAEDGAARYLDVIDIQDPFGPTRGQIVIAKEWTV